ncbi:MAG: serine/threonine protein kinase, partial [Deltaproteobacteria bacterium]
MANAATVPGLPRPFGKYRLVRHLARGGMGDVFLATLEGVLGFEQTLVIKTILPELSGNPRFVEMFAAEAKTAVLLSHGNIVPIYELGEHDGVLYIAMAYIDGAPLSDLVSAARRAGAVLPHGPALHIVRQILEGMAYAHTGDRSRPPLVHRDLSPRNVLVERSGQIRIVDFGIAMFAHVTEGARMGSAGYAAPEQQRAAAPDPRADVFSIGALLYELLTLEPAFSRAGVYAPPDLSDIPGDVRPVIERALALDPERRYPDAGAFLEALAPVLARHAATTTNREVARVAEALVFRRRPTETPTTTAIEPLETPATAATPTAVTAATRTFATRLPPTPVS